MKKFVLELCVSNLEKYSDNSTVMSYLLLLKIFSAKINYR